MQIFDNSKAKSEKKLNIWQSATYDEFKYKYLEKGVYSDETKYINIISS